MALIKCPDCGKKISDSAPTCPGCGMPNSSVAQQPVPTVIVQQAAPKKLQKKKIGCLQLISIIIIAISILGYVLSERNDQSSSRTAGTTSTPQVTAVSPSQLIRDYKANEVAADQKYKGKRLAIEGSIQDLGKDILGNIYITISGSGNSFRNVQCLFADRDADQIAQLRKGQKVKIEGTCDGLMMNVILRKCELK
jgi:hypothetical protein